jgi:hypothetical protein
MPALGGRLGSGRRVAVFAADALAGEDALEDVFFAVPFFAVFADVIFADVVFLDVAFFVAMIFSPFICWCQSQTYD